MDDKTNHPLYRIVEAWRKKIKLSKQDKKIKFQDHADKCMVFFKGSRELSDMLWKKRENGGTGLIDAADGETVPAPMFRVVINKAAELVRVFGPAMYHRNPTILVEPKSLDIPTEVLIGASPEEVQAAQMQYDQQVQQVMMQAQMHGMPPPEIPPFDPASLFPPDTQAESESKLVAQMLQYYLDYIQRENDKKTHARRMVDESLIKGLGIVWTESFESYPGAPKQIGSFQETVDNLIGDPDANTMEEWTWCARRRSLPYWEWEERFDLKRGSLKKYACKESYNGEGEQSTAEFYADDKQQGTTNDLLECWEIYSKMGMGHKLAGVKAPELNDMLDEMGKYCYLVVSEKCPFFLNIPQDALEDRLTAPEAEEVEDSDEPEEPDDMFMSVQWPIPFWADGAWPFTPLAFHEDPECAWPQSTLAPGEGPLEAICWIVTFMVNRLRHSMKTNIGVPKSLGDEIVNRLMSGNDFEVLQVDNASEPNGDISKLVHYLQTPELKPDAWRVVDMLSDIFDKATGLTELAYAMPGGVRSATEANVKQQALSVRPDDMASKVEDTMSLIARKEAMAARWLLMGDSVSEVIGKRWAPYWEKYVTTSKIDAVVREFNYRVEAGSARKPNKETRIANMNLAIQAWAPLITYCLERGIVNVPNAFLKDWGDANDIETKQYMLPPPPPQQGPSPEEIEMQMQQQEAEQSMQLEQQKHGLKVEEMQAKMQMAREKHELDAQGKVIELKLKQQEGQQKLQLAQAQGQQKMQLETVKGQQQMQMAGMKMRTDAAMQQQKLQGDAQAARMQIDVKRMEAAHKLRSQQAESAVKLKTTQDQSVAKIQQMKAQAKLKPKPKPSGGKS